MLQLESFEAVCRAIPYRRKGVFYSEAFLFLQRCEAHRVETIIESGVKFGMSTVLLRAGWDGELISIDKDSAALQAVEGVDFIHGDSRKVIPQILNETSSRRVAILIDGPKGSAAIGLMWDAMRWANVRLVGVHDIGRAHYTGGAAESCHSQDPAFRRAAGERLDDLIQHDYRKKYPQGPGLAIWEKKL